MRGNFYSRLERGLAEVEAERTRQFDKWGEQQLPNGNADSPYILNTYREAAEEAKSLNDMAGGGYDWTTVLLEEVYEALSEPTDEGFRRELVQVAAVALAIINDIDRRKENVA